MGVRAVSLCSYIKASNTGGDDHFDRGVALSADGSTLAVKAGAVYVFTRSGTTWSQHWYIKASNNGAYDRFGE